MHPRSTYLLTETFISVIINAALSLGFVYLAFHGLSRVPLAGLHGVIADTFPQTFMITLMAFLVPSLLTRHRLTKGKLPWHSEAGRIGVGRIWITAVSAALLLALVAVAFCWLTLGHLNPSGGVSFRPLAIAKVSFGAFLAAAITTWAIRKQLPAL